MASAEEDQGEQHAEGPEGPHQHHDLVRLIAPDGPDQIGEHGIDAEVATRRCGANVLGAAETLPAGWFTKNC